MSEKLLFPSLEWAQELGNRLNAIPSYKDSASNWKGTLCMAVLAEPGKLAEDCNIWLDPTGGVIKDVRIVTNNERNDATFTLLAKYSVWRDILAGKYDILKAVITGKMRLKGQLFRLMLQLKTPEITLREMRNMPSRYAENS